MKCKIEIAIDDAKSGKITDMPHGIASRSSRLPNLGLHLPQYPTPLLALTARPLMWLRRCINMAQNV